MLQKFLLLLFPAILFYVPMAIYMKRGNRMTVFYYRMAFSENTRKFYMRLLLLLLLLFHYLHHAVMNDITALIPSTVIMLCLFFYKPADRVFYAIKSRMKMYVSLLLVLILATLIWHSLFPVVVTLGFYLHAAIFYPSMKVCRMAEEGMLMDDAIALLYY